MSSIICPNLMNNGWIKLHRKITEWCWFGDPNTFLVFIHLLLMANIEDKNWRTIVIKRGSFVTSVAELAKRIGISTQQTRTALDKLISTNEITKSTTSIYTHISINNYEEYQQVTKSVTNEQQTSNKRVTTTKEYKNIRNKEIYKEKIDFDEISKKYNVSYKSVEEKYKDMVLWFEEKPSRKVGRNYNATLQNWIRRDIKDGKIKTQLPQTFKQVDLVSPEEKVKNMAKLSEIRSELSNKLTYGRQK